MRTPAWKFQLGGFTEDSNVCVCIFSSVLSLALCKQGLILPSQQRWGVNIWALPFPGLHLYLRREIIQKAIPYIFKIDDPQNGYGVCVYVCVCQYGLICQNLSRIRKV